MFQFPWQPNELFCDIFWNILHIYNGNPNFLMFQFQWQAMKSDIIAMKSDIVKQ